MNSAPEDICSIEPTISTIDSGQEQPKRIIRFHDNVEQYEIQVHRRARLLGREHYPSACVNSNNVQLDPTSGLESLKRWESTCHAIRVAGNLAVELDSALVSTTDTIFSQVTDDVIYRDVSATGKIQPQSNRCLKNTKQNKNKSLESPLCEPLLWIVKEDLVLTYNIDPWLIIDAEWLGGHRAKRQMFTPSETNLSEAHALCMNGNPAYWHFSFDEGEKGAVLPINSTVAAMQATTDDDGAPTEIKQDSAGKTTHTITGTVHKGHFRGDDETVGVLIEYCCSPDSTLCDERFLTCPAGKVKLYRLTEGHDMRKKEGVDYALSIIEKYKDIPIVIWCSIPCTGGSTLQKENEHLPSHPARMAAHNRLFRTLHSNFMTLVNAVMKTVAGVLVFEWPTRNTWWKRTEIVKMLELYKMQKADVNGCTLDVRARESGILHLKPWTLASTSMDFVDTFKPYVCPNRPGHFVHKHEPIKGGTRAKDSAHYPLKMAGIAHAVFGRHFQEYKNGHVPEMCIMDKPNEAVPPECLEKDDTVQDPGKGLGPPTLTDSETESVSAMTVRDQFLTGREINIFDLDPVWLLDTGAGRHMVGKPSAEAAGAVTKHAPSIRLNTAMGVTHSKLAIESFMGSTIGAVPMELRQLEHCDPILSVGRLVQINKFTFVWFPGFKPGIVTSSGIVIPLLEKQFTPYISKEMIQHAEADQHWASRSVGVRVLHGVIQICEPIESGYTDIPAMSVSDDEGKTLQKGGASSSSAGVSKPPRVALSVAEPVTEPMVETAPVGSPKRRGKGRFASKYEPEARNTQIQDLDTSDGGGASIPEEDESAITWNSDLEEAADLAAGTSVRRNLREESLSVAHFLLHKTTLPQHCEICMRAKTKRKKKFCLQSNRVLDRCGRISTCDHINMIDAFKSRGVDGYAYILNQLDVFTNFKQCVPTHKMDDMDTYDALVQMKGDDRWDRLYSDNWDAFQNAAKRLGVAKEGSQPGVHQTNAKIENSNLNLIYDIKGLLTACGLPGCFWPYACWYAAMYHNIIQNDEYGNSPWRAKFGQDFRGKLMPFGCGVWFLPSPTLYANSKANGTMSYGIFLGYRMAPGGYWTGQYLVADIGDFIGHTLSADTAGSEFRLYAHKTEQIALGKRGVAFPLAPLADRANMTIDGQNQLFAQNMLVSHDEFGVPKVTIVVPENIRDFDTKTDEINQLDLEAEQTDFMSQPQRIQRHLHNSTIQTPMGLRIFHTLLIQKTQS